MENLQKRIERLKRINEEVDNMIQLGYHSTNDLTKNTVAWAVCHQFYSEALAVKNSVEQLLKEFELEVEQLEKNMKDYEDEQNRIEQDAKSSCIDDDNLPF